jgi:hypothetical protein
MKSSAVERYKKRRSDRIAVASYKARRQARLDGGPGSGNFGHGGRPGEVGGSAGMGMSSFSTGATGDEVYMRSEIKDGGRVAGYMDWSEWRGTPTVKYIQVEPGDRGKGLATKMLQDLQRKYPDVEIDFGMTTPDGSKLLDAVTYEKPVPEVKQKTETFFKMKRDLDKCQKQLDRLFEVDNPTKAQQAEINSLGDKWQELYDGVNALQKEIGNEKPTKRLVKLDAVREDEEPEAWRDGEYIGAMDDFYPAENDDSVDAYRKRRQARLDARLDDDWVTIKGTHVMIDENGVAQGGGKLSGMKFEQARSVKRSGGGDPKANGNPKFENIRASLIEAKARYSAEMERTSELIEEFQNAGTDEEAENVRLKMKEHSDLRSKAHSDLERYREEFLACGAWDSFHERIGRLLPTGNNVSLKGMDIDAAEAVTKALENVIAKYPGVAEGIHSFKILAPGDPDYVNVFKSEDDKTIAAYAWGDGVYINAKYFSAENIEYGRAEYQKDLDKKFHPAGTTLESCVAHELGHAVDHYISHSLFGYQYTWQGESVSRRLWNNEVRAAERRGDPLNGKKMTEMLSGYATKDPAEYFAEAFSEYMSSASPRPAAVRAVKTINKYYEKVGAKS